MRFLITGVPGLGKTTVGNHLENKYSFKHIDFEIEDGKYLKEFQFDIGNFLSKLKLYPNVVITWGFPPNEEGITDVLYIKNELNFKLFWFDCNDRADALKHFLERDRNPNRKQEFYAQVKTIDESKVIERINPIQINPLEENGDFKGLDRLTHELTSA